MTRDRYRYRDKVNDPELLAELKRDCHSLSREEKRVLLAYLDYEIAHDKLREGDGRR
ncbi:hypothetical protein [Pseudorhodoplanes sp.]|uniref:hypothetical protein n=1 Tax=Pseudorhodoplanes sp. TaxID=1934341 RepID=UPI003D114782